MIQDPIVAEVRAIREKLAAECGFDIRKIIEEARRRQERSHARIVTSQRQSDATAGSEPPAVNEPAKVR